MEIQDYIAYAQEKGLINNLVLATNNNNYGYSHAPVQGRAMKHAGQYAYQVSSGSKKIYLKAPDQEQYIALEKGARDHKNLRAQLIQADQTTKFIFAYNKEGRAGVDLTEKILVDFLEYVGPENKNDIKALCREAVEIQKEKFKKQADINLVREAFITKAKSRLAH